MIFKIFITELSFFIFLHMLMPRIQESVEVLQVQKKQEC